MKSHTKILLFAILDLYTNPLYLVINKVNGYFEEINKNKYLTQAPTYISKEIIKV